MHEPLNIITDYNMWKFVNTRKTFEAQDKSRACNDLSVCRRYRALFVTWPDNDELKIVIYYSKLLLFCKVLSKRTKLIEDIIS